MSRLAIPANRLGNEFATMQPRIAEYLQRSYIVTFSILFLLIGIAATKVGDSYFSAKAVATNKPVAIIKPQQKIAGLNLTVNSNELEAKLQTITNQPATLTVGDNVVTLSPEKIKSWLTITHDSKKSVDYIHISAATLTKSLNETAAKFVKSPRNQVVISRPDGSSEVVVSGRDGTQLTDPKALATQAQASAKTVMDGNGLKFTTPMAVLPFQSVDQSSFNKLIEVDVVTKQMYLYEKGNLTKSYPISAGAPETPTPIGQFKIYAKFAVQDMRGNNPDGSKYFQPKVKWINYFLPGGYAVHGNYWRPASWFGVRNSSHGCVSLPDYQAKEVYDWAPIGTTVITHY